MFRLTTISCLLFLGLFARTIRKREVQTGIVPIFGNRITGQPITFTFTTPVSRTFPTLLSVELPFNDEPTSSRNYKFRAMQSSMQQMELQQNAWATYRTLWKNLGDTWNKMQMELASSPQLHQDWRQFWRDIAQTIDPYLNTLSTQFTSLFSVFLKHQQEK